MTPDHTQALSSELLCRTGWEGSNIILPGDIWSESSPCLRGRNITSHSRSNTMCDRQDSACFARDHHTRKHFHWSYYYPRKNKTPIRLLRGPSIHVRELPVVV